MRIYDDYKKQGRSNSINTEQNTISISQSRKYSKKQEDDTSNFRPTKKLNCDVNKHSEKKPYIWNCFVPAYRDDDNDDDDDDDDDDDADADDDEVRRNLELLISKK